MKILYAHNVDSSGETIAIPIQDADGNQTILPDVIYLGMEGSPTVMSGNFSIEFAGDLPIGQQVKYVWRGGVFTLDNTHYFQVNGVNLTQDQLDIDGSFTFNTVDNAGTETSIYTPNFDAPNSISGISLVDDSVPAVKMEAGTDGYVFLTETGVSVLALIKNKNIDATADIARTKLAAGAPLTVVINQAGTGVMTSTPQLPTIMGGLGFDASTSGSGFLMIVGANGTVGSLIDNREQVVSFEAGEQGDYYFFFDFPVTVTKVRASVVKPISGSDDGQLTFFDGIDQLMEGDNISSGYLPIPASSGIGDVITSTLTINNTIAAGQRVKIGSFKTTAGGAVNITLTYSRKTLS